MLLFCVYGPFNFVTRSSSCFFFSRSSDLVNSFPSGHIARFVHKTDAEWKNLVRLNAPGNSSISWSHRTCDRRLFIYLFISKESPAASLKYGVNRCGFFKFIFGNKNKKYKRYRGSSRTTPTCFHTNRFSFFLFLSVKKSKE